MVGEDDVEEESPWWDERSDSSSKAKELVSREVE